MRGRGAAAPASLLVLLVALVLIGLLLVVVFGRGEASRGGSAGPGSASAAGSKLGSEARLARPGDLAGSPREITPESRDLALRALGESRRDGSAFRGGVGTLRGHVEMEGEAEFPARWRLVLAPSVYLVGREFAETRTLDFEHGERDFEVPDLAFGGYEVRAEAEGMNSWPQYELIEASSPERFVNLRISRAGFIEGVVLDHRGDPLNGVGLVLQRLPDLAERELASDALGRFRFESVVDGPYRLYTGPSSSPLLPPRTLTMRAPSLSVPAIELPELAALEILVVDPEKLAVPFARVRGSGNGGGLVDASTDAQGTLHVRHLPPGRWRLRAEKEGLSSRRQAFELEAGETRELVFELEAQ